MTSELETDMCGTKVRKGESHGGRRRVTWRASTGLRYCELFMRRTTVTAGLPGKNGGLGESLRQKETEL